METKERNPQKERQLRMGSAGFEPMAFGSRGRMRWGAELRLTGLKVRRFISA